MAFALLFPLRDTAAASAEARYKNVSQLFFHGDLERCQQEGEEGHRFFLSSSPVWAAKFGLAEAEAMLWRGLYADSLRALASLPGVSLDTESIIRKRTLEAGAFAHLQQFDAANKSLMEAESLCAREPLPVCSGVTRARGVMAVLQGRFSESQKFFLESLNSGRMYRDRWSEAAALTNLGAAALQLEHYDEAADWSNAAYTAALNIGAENLVQTALGNLGWAYFELGDADRALDLFLEARRLAKQLGNIGSEIRWLTTAGNVYEERRDFERASQSYTQAVLLARKTGSKDDLINSLEDLAYSSIEAGRLQEAASYLSQLDPLCTASGNRLDTLDVMLARGEVASAQHRDQQAEALFREVEQDPASQASMKLSAQHELALLYERQGNKPAADRMYRTALTSFESARDQLKKEDSKIPFVTNATDIYGDYIHFLIGQGKTDQALRIADQSRAQTLEQGLGLVSHTHFIDSSDLKPTEIARKTNATLLFYWLGDKQSYLWAINSKKATLFPLPSQREIKQSITRYRKALLGIGDPAENSDSDGLALYRMLIAPAAELLPANANVVILSDGALSQLNFETLIVPAAKPHYWIEDATVVSAPSLHLLASAGSAKQPGNRLLLIGDAISPNADYPDLPMAASEMKQIQQGFDAQNQTVYSREKANAAAYLASEPQNFAYIHFVAHGVASRTDPLDSAIILSRSTADEDSFKLHAREIIQHPIHARLVTISSCYGGGTRSYAGEGSVGLAWAFLRAGGHNVIGALWEVSDESTPQLMGNLYNGVEHGLTPNASLRQAKLSLLHSQKEFRKPFYWAPFQIYTGL